MSLTELKNRIENITCLEQEPMSRHTTFKIGGPCALMALPVSVDECKACLLAAKEAGVHPVILGKGSNLLVADEGLPHFVIKPSKGMDSIQIGGTTITVGAAVSLRLLAQTAMEAGLAGLEFAHGIPGTLGGALVMNAGAYDGEMKDIVQEVQALTMHGQGISFTTKECQFAYRHSVFTEEAHLITGAMLTLQPGEPAQIQARMTELAQKRKSTQPLDYPSAGSTFKRPKDGFAAALIEQCGLKGTSIGGAQVSSKHSGFVINAGGATCENVIALMQQIQETVQRKTGVFLEPEVKILR